LVGKPEGKRTLGRPKLSDHSLLKTDSAGLWCMDLVNLVRQKCCTFCSHFFSVCLI